MRQEIKKIIFFYKKSILQTFLIIFFIVKIANAKTSNNDYYSLEKLMNKNNLNYNYNYACTFTKNESHDEFQYLLKNKYSNAMEKSSILVYGFSLARFKYIEEKRILFSSGIYNNRVNFLTIPLSELKKNKEQYVVFEYDLNNNRVIKNIIKKKIEDLFINSEKFYLEKNIFFLKSKKEIDELKKLKASFDKLKYGQNYIILLDKLRNITEISLTSYDLISKEYYVCGLYQ